MTVEQRRRVRIRPLVPKDYEFVARIDRGTGIADGWTASTPATAVPQVHEQLWRGALQNTVMEIPGLDEPIGWATAYNPSLRNGTAWIALQGAYTNDHSLALMEGMALFITALFADWPLRQLFADCTEESLSGFAGITKMPPFQVVGRYPDDRYIRGEYVDRVILNVTRDRWSSSWGPLVRARERGEALDLAALRSLSLPTSHGLQE